MIELSNYASVIGTYNGLETTLNSNSITTLLINNLEMIKTANKRLWADGSLIYTITINNPSTANYESPIITDILNPNLITLVTNSVTINGVPAGFGIYTYDPVTGLLVINLQNIFPNQSIIINFNVNKKNSEIFKLDNYASLIFSDSSASKLLTNEIVTSDVITVFGVSEIARCKARFVNQTWKNGN